MIKASRPGRRRNSSRTTTKRPRLRDFWEGPSQTTSLDSNCRINRCPSCSLDAGKDGLSRYSFAGGSGLALAATKIPRHSWRSADWFESSRFVRTVLPQAFFFIGKWFWAWHGPDVFFRSVERDGERGAGQQQLAH